jgi:putative endonuclease
MSRVSGFLVETDAKAFLLKQQLSWVSSNYQCRMGEIDLIMKDKDTLVFVEVRRRRSQDYGGALSSITYAKQQKIVKAAGYYLMTNKLTHKCAVRFDVVTLEGEGQPFQWIKNAFEGNAWY